MNGINFPATLADRVVGSLAVPKPADGLQKLQSLSQCELGCRLTEHVRETHLRDHCRWDSGNLDPQRGDESASFRFQSSHSLKPKKKPN